MKLSVSVMAHRVREAEVEELVASLDRPVEVVWDKHAKPSSQPARRWATGRAAWEAHDPEATHHLVIQDDAVASPDLIAGLEAALEYVPDGAIASAYLGTKRPSANLTTDLASDAREKGASWIVGRSLNWGPAIIAPTESINDMLAWCDRQRGTAYDKRIGLYYRDILRQATWYTWPSLVDHRAGPSICGHGSTGRHAHETAPGSALDVDWSGPVVYDERVLRKKMNGVERRTPSVPA